MTMKEIAEIANVSPTTVSMILNNKGTVSAETKKKVMEIIKKSGYQFKERSGKEIKRNIRFIKFSDEGVFAERNGDFITRVIDGIEDEARTRGADLKITNMTSSNLLEVIDYIRNENVDDGIIFLGTEFMPEQYSMLEKLQLPVVVIDNIMQRVAVDSVVMDNDAAVYLAIQHLYDLGHRKIGCISSQTKTSNIAARNLSYRLLMHEYGLLIDEKYMYTASPEPDKACESMKNELQKRNMDLPTAFFADNDNLAIGAMKAFQQLNIKVPGDVSIIGIDDLAISSVYSPALTTIKIHKESMGRKAVARLFEIMNYDDFEVIKMLLESELVVRESTGKYQV